MFVVLGFSCRSAWVDGSGTASLVAIAVSRQGYALAPGRTEASLPPRGRTKGLQGRGLHVTAVAGPTQAAASHWTTPPLVPPRVTRDVSNMTTRYRVECMAESTRILEYDTFELT